MAETSARFHLTYVAIALFGVMLLHDVWSARRDVAVLPYSRFEALVDEGKVRKVEIDEHRIRGELAEPIDGKHHFVTNRVDPELARRLEGHGVEFAGEVEYQLLPTLLSWIVPVLFFFGLWMLLMRRMAGRMGPGGSFLAVGKSKAIELMATGRLIDFEEAQAMGIVDVIFEADGYAAKVHEYARQFCPPNKASKAVGRIKRSVQSGWEVPFESGLAIERELQQQLFESPDAKEGLDAYVNKRTPSFAGV